MRNHTRIRKRKVRLPEDFHQMMGVFITCLVIGLLVYVFGVVYPASDTNSGGFAAQTK